MTLCVEHGNFGKETDGIKMSWIHDTPDMDFWESIDFINLNVAEEDQEEEEQDAD